ncbi:MAG: isoaspartyl peptidase/L-asparaginase [Anaerolineae bacterium]|nr:isoaspartyl peptidase/L-asparaginase [Anaerolineae bacterium]
MILVAGDDKDSGTALAWATLCAGAPALDAIEQGVRAVEANAEDHSVGLGGYPNALGVVELDAGVMDGRTRASGAVGGLRGFAHPVSVAYAVMRRLPHVLLIGEGAARFAAEIGAERADLLTDTTRTAWGAWCAGQGLDRAVLDRVSLVEAVWGGHDPQRPGGTTVYLAQDAAGDIAAATSTSGWAWKYPGRLGDTPVAGAGFYADNRYGAAACTGMGELAIRTGLARSAVLYMKMGMPVIEAVDEALGDVQSLPGVAGDITLYAIDAQGGYAVAAIWAGERSVEYTMAVHGDEAPTRCAARRVLAK